MLAISNYNDIKDFIDLYEDAVSKNAESFIFKGEQVLTAYAKYLIEYLTSLNK